MIIMLITSMIAPVYADAKDDEAVVLKVGYELDSGLVTIDKSGNPTGYLVDFMDGICKNNNLDYKLIPGTWKECMSRLDNHQIDLLSPLFRTDERL